MPEVDYGTLIAAARAARDRAYVPYSGYPVGAALLCGSGVIYPGCNVENAAYPMTICAERTALFAALAAGEREFIAMAVIADAERPVPPCGACRQVMLELAPDMSVLLTNVRGDDRLTTPRALLPEGFTPADLRGNARRGFTEAS
jgi:cytidine deaminase